MNNSFNILPWYDSLEKQSSKKWYAFGQSWPLLCPKGSILPFQFVCEALEVTSSIQAVNANTNEITDLGVAPSVIQGSQPNSTYYVVKLASVAVPALPIGTYYLRFNTSRGYLYSEEITIIDDASECIKIQYWNEDTLNFASGEINFADDFKFEFYIRSTIGKPEYEFEEELTKRLGYKFIESQTSNKVYKFAFVAPEYICDAMRLIRLCDYVKLTTKFDSYNALSFAYEPKWQDQGDLAAVDVEFDTDCIIQKLESFNRRIKDSFYNALLADIDEPVLFSTDTVAQYYTEFTTTSFINGKLIRQLESMLPNELQSNLLDLVLPIDNMADDKNTAKKISLPDLMSLVNSSDVSKLFKGHFDADGNLQWIEALSHIGVNGGVTMFIDNDTISLPQLYAGLPIDGRTLIRDSNGVLMVNPNVDFGGGAATWDELEGKPSWIGSTKPSYKYSEISEKPDLSVYALAKDLEKYVTLNTEQTIAAQKNFINGLSVGGLPITKSQDDVLYLDANLVVRGGITMFGTNSVDVPTIMDAIATDNVNLKVVDGVLTFVDSSGGGLTEVYWDDVIGRPTLLSSFIDDVGYLQKSGGQMTGNIGYTLTPDSYEVGLPAAGSFEYTSVEDFSSSKSFIGSVFSRTWNEWYNLISVRHRNGKDDGHQDGMYILSHITTTNENLSWNRQRFGVWLGERVILDSVNWSQYVTAANGGSYLPLSGGEINSTNGSFALTIKANFHQAIRLQSNQSETSINYANNAGDVWVLGANAGGAPNSFGLWYNPLSKLTFSVQKSGCTHIWYNGATINGQDGSYTEGIRLYGASKDNSWSEINFGCNDLYGSHPNQWTIGRNGDQTYRNEFTIRTHNSDKFVFFRTGDFLVAGGITMYSDIRKKTKLQDVELTLQQIADAPLIEHYYNSDEKKTTHVGSIAQYWASMNDWFCKLDGEGFYTMEIQNAALASAISIARELVKYESKTDRKIRLLKDEVKRLKKEIKILKSA
ncbi:MAG: hypothetical protein IKU15_07795 [Clostridia bacterium]|nr:hypothetical protein [Clostridia bacterium]